MANLSRYVAPIMAFHCYTGKSPEFQYLCTGYLWQLGHRRAGIGGTVERADILYTMHGIYIDYSLFLYG